MNKTISFVAQKLLGGLCVTVNQKDGRAVRLAPEYAGSDGEDEIFTAKDGGVSVSVRARDCGGTVILYARVEAESPLAAESSAVFDSFDFEGSEKILYSYKQSPWWTLNGFCEKLSQLSGDCCSVLVKRGELNCHIFALTGEDFKCIIRSDGLHLNTGCEGRRGLSGAFLTVASSTEALGAINANFENAREARAINVPLREDRAYPDVFNYLGFCSWNAFYHDVTSEGLCEKAAEFREKRIPVKWMIIDDGWLDKDGRYLCGFEADKAKFPDGLKACVRRLREEYGVKYVGVWHALNGYWNGVKKDSPLHRLCADVLYETDDGWLIPSPVDEEKAFVFYDRWHTFLRECGVDFLKVDNQSSSINFLKGGVCPVSGARVLHRALERSVDKNFGGRLINCMGMDIDNVLSRPGSGLSRNSDDFFPDRDKNFISHINQNAYNALWHSRIYHCDFDMWWSVHESATQSGVLRAISGGPIYVSDKLGLSDAEKLLPTSDANGDIGKLDDYARPTSDCIYTDCVKERKLLKLFNRKGGAYAAAVYNLCGEEISDTLCFDTVSGLRSDIEYIAYEYFTGKYYRVNFSSELPLTLEVNGVLCFSIYPITHPDDSTEQGTYILMGDTSKYVPVGMSVQVKRMVGDIPYTKID